MRRLLLKTFISTCILLISFWALGQTKELITSNGDFKNGSSSGWSRTGDVNIVGSGFSFCKSCPGYVAMGVDKSGYGKDHAYGTLQRTITIPSNVKKNSSATLTFYLYITTKEIDNTTAYDILDVEMKTSSGSGYSGVQYSNRNTTSGYTKKTLTMKNIDNYAGKSMTLKWIQDSDGRRVSTFRIDDVSLKVELEKTSKPDITSWNHSVSPQSIFAGDKLSLYCYHGYKTGKMSSPTGTYIGYFLSEDDKLDSSDDLIEDDYEKFSSSNAQDDESYTYSKTSNLKPGNYYILFVADYKDDVDEGSGENNNVTAIPFTVKTKLPGTGILGVSITPKESIDDGARWMVDNDGVWRKSGMTKELKVGEHSVKFLEILKWDEPQDMKVNIVGGSTQSFEGKYVSNFNVPSVRFISPNQYTCYESGKTMRIEAELTGDFHTKIIEWSMDGKNWHHIKTIGGTNRKIVSDFDLDEVLDVTYFQVRIRVLYGINQEIIASTPELCVIVPPKEFFSLNADKDGISRLFWPFEIDKYSWYNQGRWDKSNGHGTGRHISRDHYSLDYGKYASKFVWETELKGVYNGTCNEDFYSPLEGDVIYVTPLANRYSKDCDNIEDVSGGLGNMVAIQAKNDENFIFVIGHLNEISVEKGKISRGDKIGELGSTGASEGPHAHCVLYKNVYQSYEYNNEPNVKHNLYDLISSGDYTKLDIDTGDPEEFDDLMRIYAAEFDFSAKKRNGGGQLGIIKSDSQALYYFFPNPSSDILNLQFTKIPSEVTLHNSFGQVIIKTKPSQNFLRLYLHHLPSGIYIVSLKISDQEYREKIIKR